MKNLLKLITKFTCCHCNFTFLKLKLKFLNEKNYKFLMRESIIVFKKAILLELQLATITKFL